MNRNNAAPHWIAVDWSESGMRAWALDSRDAVLMKVRSAQGLAQIAPEAFETVLFNLVRPWLIREQTPIIVSGVPGSVLDEGSGGCASVPCRPAALRVIPVKTADSRLSLHFLPDLRPPGSDGGRIACESLIRGIAAEMPDYFGAICIPGKQTLWLTMNSGEIIGTKMFMTAELADLIAPQDAELMSVPEVRPDRRVFVNAVADAMEQPELTFQHAISAREDVDPAKAWLKGLLIGQELAGARDAWQGQRVLVVGPSPWSTLYEQGLSSQGVSVQPCDSDQMTLAGLTHAYRSLCETFAQA